MKTLLGAVTLSLLAWVLPAHAASINVTLGNSGTWSAPDASTLSLVAAPAKVANQPRDKPCVICGGNQPQQPPTFGYNDFQNTGNDTDLAFFSSGTFKEQLPYDTLAANNYSGLFLTNFLIGLNDPTLTFSIGIDMNQATGKGAQTLESFFFLNLTQHTVLAAYSPGPGGTLLPSLNNGTGYADYLLTGLNLNGIAPTDQVAFYSRISGANDGPDSFFIRANVSPVPLPAGIWLFGTAIAGLGALKVRRRRSTTQFAA